MNKAAEVINEVKKAFVGRDSIAETVMLSVLARGHILLEDIPGVGKTTLALAFSKSMNLKYGRMQFTPDVLPSDIVGYSMLNKDTGKFEYKPGVVFCNVFLADELNRATSRTQSALLEAMEEGQVTVDGISHAIERPFLVIATQNPFGASGTQKLPDSQIDRFTVKISIGYPDPSQEADLIKRKNGGDLMANVKGVITAKELEEMQNQVSAVFVSDPVIDYIVRLINATRHDQFIMQGASPRATIALTSMAKAAAWYAGRDYVIPEDVGKVFTFTVGHRMIYAPEAPDGFNGRINVLDKILGETPLPRI